MIGMDLRDRVAVATLIAREHWRKGKALRQIEIERGIGKTSLSAWCKRHGIDVRTKEQQCAISNRRPEVVAKRSGELHWAYGKRKETDEWARKHSQRMKRSNAYLAPGAAEKAAKARAVDWRERPRSEYEVLVRDMLTDFGAKFIYQKPAGKYVIDFAIGKVALEIDSGSKLASHGLPRDRWLVERGWVVIRARHSHVLAPAKLFAVLKQFVPYLKIPRWLPATRREYRVLVRDKQSPAGRKV